MSVDRDIGAECWSAPCWEYWEGPVADQYMRVTREDAERICAECYAVGMGWGPLTEKEESFARGSGHNDASIALLRQTENVCRALPDATAWVRSGHIPIVPLIAVRVKVCASKFWRDARWCPEGCRNCAKEGG